MRIFTTSTRKFPTVVTLATLLASTTVSCSQTSEAGTSSISAGSGGATRGGEPAGGGRTSGEAPELELPSGGQADAAGGSASDGAVCNALVREGQRVPVDLYFLVDSSGSMDDFVSGGSKWQVVSSALIEFLRDPRSAGVGAGIGYFPSESGSCTAGQPGCFCVPNTALCFATEDSSCEASEYSNPDVKLALPTKTAAIVSDIQAHTVGGGTPTRPALEGALDYLNAWASQHPERKPVLVLATDGDPDGCEANTPDDVADVAARALQGSNQIRTFVIGVGSSLVSLDLVARAGGTDRAFLVDTGGDVARELADALDSIRGVAASCDFTIPRASTGSEPIDPTKVNVSYRSNGSNTPTRVPQTTNGDAATCHTSGGWYYDAPAAPTSIKLCDTTCQSLSTGSIQVEFGCDTVQQPPR